MAVTIKDIARVAGVSHTTVSRALHDHPAHSNQTILRIKKIAEEMGYLPSATARGLKTRRSRSLGVIVSRIDDPFWSEVLQGIDNVLHPAGYSLFIAATQWNQQREQLVVQTMVQRGVDGVIICAPQFSADQSLRLKSFGISIVVVNNEGAEDYQYSIFHDDGSGIRAVTRHLIQAGHQNIAFLGNAHGGQTTINREQGFREEVTSAGLKVDAANVHRTSEATPSAGFQGAQVLMSVPKLPTAIVCYNDNLAIGVYSALSNAGIRIPEDISVTGFDNIAIAPYMTPPLTTFHQPKYDLGFGAAKIMLKLLEQREKTGSHQEMPEPEKVALQGELIIRNSTSRLLASYSISQKSQSLEGT